uniref:Uncharacterized protein n=1 Tax=Rhizophora mucronata TaxID=61149 RepID=A0A2P2N4V3_RHIMU
MVPSVLGCQDTKRIPLKPKHEPRI